MPCLSKNKIPQFKWCSGIVGFMAEHLLYPWCHYLEEKKNILELRGSKKILSCYLVEERIDKHYKWRCSAFCDLNSSWIASYMTLARLGVLPRFAVSFFSSRRRKFAETNEMRRGAFSASSSTNPRLFHATGYKCNTLLCLQRDYNHLCCVNIFLHILAILK